MDEETLKAIQEYREAVLTLNNEIRRIQLDFDSNVLKLGKAVDSLTSLIDYDN